MAKKKKKVETTKESVLGHLYNNIEILAIREKHEDHSVKCDNPNCLGEIHFGETVVSVYNAWTGARLSVFHGTHPYCIASLIATHTALSGGVVVPIGPDDWGSINWNGVKPAIDSLILIG